MTRVNTPQVSSWESPQVQGAPGEIQFYTLYYTMKILIADDQSGVRSALRLLLEQHPECSIVAEAENTVDLLEKAAQTHPDLVLLDAELAGLPGRRGEQAPGALEDLLAGLKGKCCQAKVIVLSIRPEVRGQVLACGVDAFVSKADPPEALLSVIQKLCLQSVEDLNHRWE